MKSDLQHPALPISRFWRTDRRYYFVIIEHDLFGTLVLSQYWGGLGNRMGRSVSVPHADLDEAMTALNRIDALRSRHGYLRVSPWGVKRRTSGAPDEASLRARG